MDFKEGDIVEIRNENIKVLTPVTFINGKELIFFTENSYDTKTHCLRIKVGDHFQSFLNCQIKKGSKKEYVDARLKELMKEEIKAVLIDGKYRLIDLEISGLIESLNKAGRKTLYCCAGHKDEYRECRAYISFENTRENREFISRIALRRIENEMPIDKINSEFLIKSPCIICLRYGKEHRKEILENFIKLFYDETGNIVS